MIKISKNAIDKQDVFCSVKVMEVKVEHQNTLKLDLSKLKYGIYTESLEYDFGTLKYRFVKN